MPSQQLLPKKVATQLSEPNIIIVSYLIGKLSNSTDIKYIEQQKTTTKAPTWNGQ